MMEKRRNNQKFMKNASYKRNNALYIKITYNKFYLKVYNTMELGDLKT